MAVTKHISQAIATPFVYWELADSRTQIFNTLPDVTRIGSSPSNIRSSRAAGMKITKHH